MTKRGAINNIIYGWKHPLKKAFPRILAFYCPPPAVVVDLCSGYKEFYRRLVSGGIDSQGYKFIFGDIRNLPGNHFVADCRYAPLKPNIADCVVFDPPYMNGHAFKTYTKLDGKEKFTLDELWEKREEVEKWLKEIFGSTN